MRKAILMLASVLALSGLCAADSFYWQDVTSGVPGTVYTLVTSPAGCTTSCGATLTITTSAVSNAYIGWIGFHLDSGNAAVISGIPSGSFANWSVATGSGVTVPWGSSNGNGTYALPGTGGWSAIYANGLPSKDFSNALSLSGGQYTATFNFAWTGAGTLNAFPSLQVGYYLLDSKGGYKTTQMSQVAAEPAAASFVALSLAALFAFRRRLAGVRKS